tara:strand:+ start:1542 stop:1922 length:381 start_codon:yes stop_codon:yes gene_type:complete
MEETRTTRHYSNETSNTPIEGREVSQRGSGHAVKFDLEAYMPLLEDTDIPEAEKMELLRALYAIMASFVDLGFSLEASPCGKLAENNDQQGNRLRDHVYSSHSKIIERFENAADVLVDVAGEGSEA